MSRRAAVILLVAGALQVGLACLPDTMGDLGDYRTWMRNLTRDGLAEAYWPPKPPPGALDLRAVVDYPPLFPYALWTLGHATLAWSPAAFDDDHLSNVLIRLLLVLANLLLAALVYRETLRIAPRYADLSLALMAFNPALVFATSYWGQADAPYLLLTTVAIVLLVRGHPECAWAALAAAVLTKPLAAALAPLVVVESLKRFGWRRALRSALAVVATVGAAYLPFLAIGRFADGLVGLFVDLDAMPFASVNAHNLWWLVGRGIPWTEAAERPLGLLSCKVLGLALFGILSLWSLVWLWRASDPRAAYVAAATILFGFFTLSTHMHENHLLGALPFLALAAPGAARVRGLLIAVTLASLANMALHDPHLASLVRPSLPGPLLRLPQQLGLDPSVADHMTRQGFPAVAAEIRGEVSLLGMLATLGNAQLVVLLFACWIFLVGGGFDSVLGRGGSWPPWRLGLPVAAVFLLATGVPFVRHALGYGQSQAMLVLFPDAEVRTRVADHVGITSFEIDGDLRYVLFVHPPSEVRYRLTLPRDARLRFGMALSPAVWDTARGDGAGFEIRIETEARSDVVFSRYIDPKRNPGDRHWHDDVVDLSRHSGRELTLVFTTTGGPDGNTDYDWAAFSDPVITTP